MALALSACSNSELPGNQASDADWAIFDAPASGQANHWQMVDGEFVGTDEIHFARGANADGLEHEQYYAPGGVPPEPQPTPVEDDDVYRHSTWGAFGTDRAAHNGDYLLPTDLERWPDFTADLGLLRLEATATDLYVQLRFVSFPSPQSQIATLTITRAGSSPELSDWPRNAGIRSQHSHALTLYGEGAWLQDNAGQELDIATLGGATRVSDHAFEARIPLSALPDGPWLMGIGAGLADPQQPDQYWTVPAGAPSANQPGTDTSNAPGANVWDLMFTPHDPRWHDDHLQAQLLLDGDVSAAQVRVDPAQLQARATLAAPRFSGRVAHTYLSAFDFGDGIVRGSPGTPPVPAAPVPAGVKPRDTAVNYEYTGRMQPYFAYIPAAYEASTHDWPLVLYFHGLNNYIWEPFGLTLGLEDQLEARGYLFASLLGRGDISFEGRGELDPLEVIAHISARYRIDPSRIYLVGHSHGGGGVMNVSRRNPDRFAAVVSAQITEAPVVTENFLHTPTLHIAGAQDPIDSGTSARQRYQAAADLGYDSQLLIYQSKTHENSSIHDALDLIFDLYDRSQQPLNPAVVDYSRAGNDFDESLGLLHDGAWWVSGMVAADPVQRMRVQARSLAIAHATLDPAAASRTDDQLVDTSGPSGRSIGLLSATTPAYGAPIDVANRAELTSTNLVAVSLDTARMQLDLRQADARITLNLSHELQLSLTGLAGTQSLAWRQLDANGNELSRGQSTAVNGRYEISVAAAATELRFSE